LLAGIEENHEKFQSG